MPQDMEFDCSMMGEVACPPVKPDPDIAGIGVLWSFLASVIITLVSTCLYLILVHSDDTSAYNPLDRKVWSWTSTPLVRTLERYEWFRKRKTRIERTLFAAVLGMADTQLVTGIAMMSAALIRMQVSGSISVYHFDTMMNLAWFTSNLHLLALVAIRWGILGSILCGHCGTLRHR